MRLYNTLTRKIEEFKPLHDKIVNLYSCGPTVYDYTHIGHLRTYVNNDILRRVLEYVGYQVSHVMNITDVGHLTGDDDEGEDKLEKGARKEGKNVWEIASFYTNFFTNTTAEMNILPPHKLVKATEHIGNMIAVIKKLENKGFTYQTKEALYFDISKFPNYGRLSGQKLDEKVQKARKEVYVDPEKKHPADFALWFKRVGRFANHTMHWNSPWGDGFPGWHIECSAMSMKYLGETIDVHTGGTDHIPVHHENEIAQSEAATGKPFVKYWFHNEFLLVEGQKMSKSLGNFFTLNDVIKRGVNPMALRLLYLQTHYRKQMNFTWEAAKGAQEAYDKLKEYVIILQKQTQRTILSEEKLSKIDTYRKKFVSFIGNDLQIPQAVAVVWEIIKSNIPSKDKFDLLLEFDRVFGLRLSEIEEEKIPVQIVDLAKKRVEARNRKDFDAADRIRKQVEEKGYLIEDLDKDYKIKKK